MKKILVVAVALTTASTFVSYIFLNLASDSLASTDTMTHKEARSVYVDIEDIVRNYPEIHIPISKEKHNTEPAVRISGTDNIDFRIDESVSNSISEMINSEEYSRKQKIESLTDMIKRSLLQHPIDATKMQYLLETISFLKPIEESEFLLTLANSGHLPESVINAAVLALAESATLYTDMDVLAQVDIESARMMHVNSETIKSSLIDIARRTQSDLILSTITKSFPRIYSSEEQHILEEIIRPDGKAIDSHDQIYARFGMAIGNSASLEANLPEILYEIRSGELEDRTALSLNGAISGFVSHLYEDGNSSMIGPVAKQALMVHMDSLASSWGNEFNHQDPGTQNQQLSSWLATYSLLATNSPEQRVTFLQNHFVEAPPWRKAIAAEWLDESGLFDKVMNSPSTQAALQSALADTSLRHQERQVLLDAAKRMGAYTYQ